MKKLPYKIRGMIEWNLEHYHEDKKQLEQLKKDLVPSYTAKYDKAPVIAGPSDTTADTAIKIISTPYIASLERTIKAIDRVLSKCDDIDLELIDLVYWKHTHTITGAALKVNLSKTPAYYRINKILYAIAVELGLVAA